MQTVQKLLFCYHHIIISFSVLDIGRGRQKSKVIEGANLHESQLNAVKSALKSVQKKNNRELGRRK